MRTKERVGKVANVRVVSDRGDRGLFVNLKCCFHLKMLFRFHSVLAENGLYLGGAAAPDERWVVLGLERLQVHSQTIRGCTLVALLLQMEDGWF